MSEFYSDPLVTLLHGDCIEVMRELPADSVDAVVTDPPYGISFMGKAWDGPAIAAIARRDAETRKSLGPHSETRPGRSEPRSTSAFGSPASTAGAYDFSVKGNHAFQAWCEQWGREALRVTKPGGYLLAFGGTRTHHRLVCAIEDAGWIIRDELDWIYASGFPKGKANLKPAHEPIVLARKPGPLRSLAIDECRIGFSSDADRASAQALADLRIRGMEAGIIGQPGQETVYQASVTGYVDNEPYKTPEGGRWPSNVLLSDPELFDEPNPYVVGSGAIQSSHNTVASDGEILDSGSSIFGNRTKRPVEVSDSGGYSRFFIVPKADRAERERGLAGQESEQDLAFDDFNRNVGNTVAQRRANVHPTVKPIDLMRHLVRLVTPAGGVVVDPFLGSGTTCLAASELGVRSIGIEREAEYLEIAKGRLIATPMGLGLDVRTYNPEEVA